jgi:hypothetical protein
MMGMDAHHHPGVLILAALHRRLKITAVQQHGPIAQAAVLIGLMAAEDDKGIVLVAGGPPGAAHALHPGAQGRPVQAPLHEMMSVEGDKVHIGVQEIQAQGGAFAQPDRTFPHVFHPYRPGDEVQLLKYAKIKAHHHLGGGVHQMEDQGFGFPPAVEKSVSASDKM